MLSTPFPIILNESDILSPDVKDLLNTGYYRAISYIENEKCFLRYYNQSLMLQLRLSSHELNLCIDFVGGKAKHRRQYGGGKNQPLPKSCGLDKHPEWTILDATAGLGKDAFVLASLGAEVTLCEQHPALYGLLTDALNRAAQNRDVADIAKRMTCIFQDSVSYLNENCLSATKQPDVIYLDPMYPNRKKSAKIKKEMQVLQYLTEHTGSDDKLLTAALQAAVHRVVVKRPKSAPSLNDQPVSYTVNSVNTRYDVYVI